MSAAPPAGPAAAGNPPDRAPVTAPIRGLIFDKDGTLFDFNATWGAWTRGMLAQEIPQDLPRRAALAQALGYDWDSATFHPGSVVIAETLSVLADHMLPFLPDVAKPALMARMEAAATDVPQVEVAPLAALLTGLQRRGLVLGLATNDSEGPARAHLGRAGVLDRFAFIAGSDSGFGGKPETGQLRAFCRQTGIAPENCAMIGDSLHDLKAGRAAGMTTIGVLTGPALAADLRDHADGVLPSIAALAEWLQQNGRI